MFRQKYLLGLAVTAFGAGMLFGLWVGTGFVSHCVGVGLIILGCVIMRKR